MSSLKSETEDKRPKLLENFWSLNIGHVASAIVFLTGVVWSASTYRERVSLIESDIASSKKYREVQLAAIDQRLSAIEKSREETQSIIVQIGVINAKFEGLAAKVDGVKDAVADMRAAQRDQKH